MKKKVISIDDALAELSNQSVTEYKQTQAIESAIAEYNIARDNVNEFTDKVNNLRERIKALDAVIADTEVLANQLPALDGLSIEQIQEAADEQQRHANRLVALKAARDQANKEIADFKLAIQGQMYYVADAQTMCWSCVLDDLISKLPDGLLLKIHIAAHMAHRTPLRIFESSLQSFDENSVNALAEIYGIPA